MAATVTKILLGKVFTKEENEIRMLILGEKGFFGVCMSVMMLLPLNQIYFWYILNGDYSLDLTDVGSDRNKNLKIFVNLF